MLSERASPRSTMTATPAARRRCEASRSSSSEMAASLGVSRTDTATVPGGFRRARSTRDACCDPDAAVKQHVSSTNIRSMTAFWVILGRARGVLILVPRGARQGVNQ
eukprot:scaffold4079_cov129-Isochrysis_galbana.AAC.4